MILNRMKLFKSNILWHRQSRSFVIPFCCALLLYLLNLCEHFLYSFLLWNLAFHLQTFMMIAFGKLAKEMSSTQFSLCNCSMFSLGWIPNKNHPVDMTFFSIISNVILSKGIFFLIFMELSWYSVAKNIQNKM